MKIIFYHLRDSRNTLQPHYITKKEMIEINEQTTTKVKYPYCFMWALAKKYENI